MTEPSSGRVGVLQVVDSLTRGGGERVAVNLANLLPRDRYQVHLCVTREDGALASELSPDVPKLVLGREGRLDELPALVRFIRYVREHDLRILHAHLSSFFFTSLAALFLPGRRVIWHDHYGGQLIRSRPAWPYRIATRRLDGIISVTAPLAEWATGEVGFRADRVWYIRNFVCPPEAGVAPELPGPAGRRIVCVANGRPEKDTSNLVRAMARVVREVPDAQAVLVGRRFDSEYFSGVKKEIQELGLSERITLLGERGDVSAILGACDVGVLSSASEGLPLALIEYGMAGLASVSTEVGQCGEVLDEGRVGRIVPPRDPEALAAALVELLRSPEERARLGEGFRRFARERFGPEGAIDKICAIYERLLQDAETRIPAR
jgi:glycosyltransferase involved in cell wall biosynthesis